MKKFTFIGAGSLEFTRDLVRDLMTFPAFRDSELMLMDVDAKRLEYAKRGVERIMEERGALIPQDGIKDSDSQKAANISKNNSNEIVDNQAETGID